MQLGKLTPRLSGLVLWGDSGAHGDKTFRGVEQFGKKLSIEHGFSVSQPHRLHQTVTANMEDFLAEDVAVSTAKIG